MKGIGQQFLCKVGEKSKFSVIFTSNYFINDSTCNPFIIRIKKRGKEATQTTREIELKCRNQEKSTTKHSGTGKT